MRKQDDVEGCYQFEAKRVVDMLFDKECLKPDLNRDTINAIEDLIAYLFQSQAQSAVRTSKLLIKLKGMD